MRCIVRVAFVSDEIPAEVVCDVRRVSTLNPGLSVALAVADDHAMRLSDLNGPERALWKAFPRGAPVDLRSGDSAEDDPAKGNAWNAHRVVRAEVVTALLLGAGDLEKGCAPAIRLVGARITGRLDVMAAEISHALVLSRCWLDHAPRFVEATTRTIRISDCHLPGFDGNRMHTDGILDLQGCVIGKAIRLDRAHVVGPLRLRGVVAGEGIGEAIAGTGLIVDGDMECDGGFTARGQVTLHGARIAGQLTFRDAVLTGTPVSLHLRRLQADELCLRTAQPITGAIWLAPARVGTLDDDPAVWPAEIWLSGFTYDVIRDPAGRVPVSERLDWVSRGPFGYQPRPYEQLADYYRRAGHDVQVRHVLLAKQRHERTTLSAPRRAVGRLLDATVGYGYRPWLAALWLALLLTAGTIVYTIQPPHALTGGPVPPFNAFFYTLDLLIPIGAFGLRSAYASSGPAQWLAYTFITAGWILATAVIAGITRAIRRD